MKARIIGAALISLILALLTIGAIDPLLSNRVEMMDRLFVEPLMTTVGNPEVLNGTSAGNGFSKNYIFRANDGYTYEIGIPSSVDSRGYGGFVVVQMPSVVTSSGNKYEISLLLHPRSNDDWLYVLSIADTSNYESTRYKHLLGSAVDRDGNQLGRHPEDSEEFYQRLMM